MFGRVRDDPMFSPQNKASTTNCNEHIVNEDRKPTNGRWQQAICGYNTEIKWCQESVGCDESLTDR